MSIYFITENDSVFKSLKTYKPSKEEIDACSEVLACPKTGPASPVWGLPRPDMRKKFLEDNPAKRMTEETKRKISQTMKGVSKSDQTKKNMSAAQQKQSKHLSDKMKGYLSNEDNYNARIEQMKEHCNSKEALEKKSKKMSAKKWCNDGKRNYRLEIDKIPTEYKLGKITPVKV
jgi:hypothetical protein